MKTSHDRLLRAGLGLLVLEGLVIGTPALFFPHWFYLYFPFGQGWLTTFGDYSEHFTRDVGALYLGLTVVGAYTWKRLIPEAVAGVGLANAVAAFPHMVFHIAMWRMCGFWPTVVQAGSLALTVLIGLALIGINRARGVRTVIVSASDPRSAGADRFPSDSRA